MDPSAGTDKTTSLVRLLEAHGVPLVIVAMLLLGIVWITWRTFCNNGWLRYLIDSVKELVNRLITMLQDNLQAQNEQLCKLEELENKALERCKAHAESSVEFFSHHEIIMGQNDQLIKAALKSCDMMDQFFRDMDRPELIGKMSEIRDILKQEA